MATTPTVIVVSELGNFLSVAGVFNTIEAAKAYTGVTGTATESPGGDYWNGHRVWVNIPVNPTPPRRGGRKKTARRRRRTTRKH
jgi:hypothetical protein